MSCGRFLAPLLPVWWLTVRGAAHFVARARPAWLVASALALAALNLTFLSRLAHGGGNERLPAGCRARGRAKSSRRVPPLELPFLELATRATWRDAILAEELKRVVTQVATVTPGKIWLASGQAGGAPYHLFGAFPHKLRFIDFWGLTNSEARPCLPARKLKHSSLGRRVDPRALVPVPGRRVAGLRRALADIVFNTGLRAGTRRGLEQRGLHGDLLSARRHAQLLRPKLAARRHERRRLHRVRRELAERLQLEYRERSWTIAGG